MVRRVFVPPVARATDVVRASLRPNLGPWAQSVPPPRSTLSPPASNGLGSRRSLPPPGSSSEGVPVAACAQLVDRLAATEDAPFVVNWIEGVACARGRTEPALAVRLLRAYREAGRFDRARDYAASLPALPPWPPLETARLSIERAILAAIDGRLDHAEAEVLVASRTLSGVPRPLGQREHLDLHLVHAQVEIQLEREGAAAAALQEAERLADRIEDGAWRAPVSMTLGHLAVRLAAPRAAAKHFALALGRVPSRDPAALDACGNLAVTLASLGRIDEARQHAHEAIAIVSKLATDWRHADAYDALAMVEVFADQPAEALRALEEATVALGDLEHPTLRRDLAEHRAHVLAMLGQGTTAEIWIAKARALREELGEVHWSDDLRVAVVRARVLEACGRLDEAIAIARDHADRAPTALTSGELSLVVGRCALSLGDETAARAAVERAALAGDARGWIFPERQASLALWQMARTSGDSRVVRYAERILSMLDGAYPFTSIPAPPAVPSFSPASLSPPGRSEGLGRRETTGEPLVYVTTPDGVSHLPLSAVHDATRDATLVVDTLSHALSFEGRRVSLERRRALEPLVVQLLRRAREGLSTEEILSAAGGPGPESADAEHRVRVLISRVRDLVGGVAAIDRLREAGEHGRTRYRLAAIPFALIEPG